MLPTPVEEAIRGMAEDRTSGASKLARLAVDTMGLAIVNAKGRPDPKELAEVARRISEAQPAMAIVHNVAQLVARLVSKDSIRRRSSWRSERSWTGPGSGS